MARLDVRETLDQISEEQGWDDASEIIHLTGFLNSSEISVSQQEAFKKYLLAIQKEENSIEAVCERCEAPCDYHSEICLCENCKIEATSS